MSWIFQQKSTLLSCEPYTLDFLLEADKTVDINIYVFHVIANFIVIQILKYFLMKIIKISNGNFNNR